MLFYLLTDFLRPIEDHITSVQVTGNFDNWSKSNKPFVRDGKNFIGSIIVPKREKLVFKFVINGDNWVVSKDYKIENDSNGIENNFLEAVELEQVVSKPAVPASVSPITFPVETANHESARVTSEVLSSNPKPTAASSTTASKGIAATTSAAAVEKVIPHITTLEALISESSAKPSPKVSNSDAPKTAPPIKAPATTTPPDAPTATATATPIGATTFASGPTTATPTEKPSESFDSTSPEPLEAINLPLTQVITTESSFAGVSLPSQDSAFEHLDETEEEEEDINQFNTPTNSVFNSGLLPSPNKDEHQNLSRKNNVEILQAPGAFPASSASSTSKPSPSDKKEGLVTRFKSLFRY